MAFIAGYVAASLPATMPVRGDILTGNSSSSQGNSLFCCERGGGEDGYSCQAAANGECNDGILYGSEADCLLTCGMDGTYNSSVAMLFCCDTGSEGGQCNQATTENGCRNPNEVAYSTQENCEAACEPKSELQQCINSCYTAYNGDSPAGDQLESAASNPGGDHYCCNTSTNICSPGDGVACPNGTAQFPTADSCAQACASSSTN